MIKLIRKNKGLTVAISVLAVVFSIPIFYLLWLNWVFSADKHAPKDENYIVLFEKGTGAKFPKSGELINKSFYGQVLSDGWEGAVIKIKDTIEFKTLKNEIKSKSFMIEEIRKGGAYFEYDLKNNLISSDTTFYNYRVRLKLEFIEEGHMVIFEQSW